MSDPAAFVPTEPNDFIGEARRLALMIINKAKAMKALVEELRQPAAAVKLLFYGAPGIGKTRLAELFASQLAYHPTAIESINGRNVNIDVVRRWQDSNRYVPMGRFGIRILNEVDLVSPLVQDVLLTFLDAVRLACISFNTKKSESFSNFRRGPGSIAGYVAWLFGWPCESLLPGCGWRV